MWYCLLQSLAPIPKFQQDRKLWKFCCNKAQRQYKLSRLPCEWPFCWWHTAQVNFLQILQFVLALSQNKTLEKTMYLCSLSHLEKTAAHRPAMWQSLAAQRQICEGSMNYLWQALLCLLVSSILQEGISQKCQQIQWRNMCSGTYPRF